MTTLLLLRHRRTLSLLLIAFLACWGIVYAGIPHHFLYLRVFQHEPERLADHELGFVPADPNKPFPITTRRLCYARVIGELPRFTVERLVDVLTHRGLRGVDLSAQRDFGDQDCGSLGAMTSLQYLDLMNTGVTDVGILALSRISGLTVLRLGSHVTDAGMATIGSFKNLTVLNLMQSSVSDAGLARVLHLPLRRLELGSAITDAGLKSLAPLKKIRHLDLSQTPITGAAVAALADFPHLETLLAPHRWNSAALIDLTELSNLQNSLRRLDLTNTDIDDHATGLLVLFKNLEELALSGTGAGDTAVRRLARLSQLRALELSDTLMTGAGLGELRALPRLEVLSISISSHLSAGDLRVLSGMRKLRLLIVNGHPIAGVRLETLMSKLNSLKSKPGDSHGAGDNSSDVLAELGPIVPAVGLHRLEDWTDGLSTPPDEDYRFEEST